MDCECSQSGPDTWNPQNILYILKKDDYNYRHISESVTDFKKTFGIFEIGCFCCKQWPCCFFAPNYKTSHLVAIPGLPLNVKQQEEKYAINSLTLGKLTSLNTSLFEIRKRVFFSSEFYTLWLTYHFYTL